MLRTCGRFALVDEDPGRLATVDDALPPGCSVAVVRTALELARLDGDLERTRRLLRDEQAALMSLAASQSGLDPLAGGPPAAVQALRYFANADRLRMVLGMYVESSAVRGRAMRLCVRHRMAGLQRTLLLTSDSALAQRAFNAGAIDRCVQRNAVAHHEPLLEQVRRASVASGRRRGELLALPVRPELLQALAIASVARRVEQFLERYGVAEHIVLGAPQGILGLTAAGKAIWFQLETQSSLAELMEVLEEYEWSREVRERVAARKATVSEVFMGQLGKRATEHDIRLLSHAPLLGAGVFPLGELPPELTPAVGLAATQR